jgi:hypothetical protein
MLTHNPDPLAKAIAFGINHCQAIPGVMFIVEVRIETWKIEKPLIEGFDIARQRTLTDLHRDGHPVALL